MKKIKPGRFASSWPVLSLAVACAAILSSIQGCRQSGATEAEKAALLPKADKSYYYLQSQGLKAFRCTVQLNLKQSDGDQSKFAQLNKIQFSVVVDDRGSAKVTPFLASGRPIDHSLDEIVSTGQQLAVAFFQMWDSFVFTGMFSGSDDEKKMMPWEQPDGFHYSGSFADGSREFVLTKDALLTTMRMTSEGTTLLMQPKFTKTDGGLWLMTGIDTDKTVESSPINEEEKLSLQIQYQPLQGFQLPAKAEYQTTLSTDVVTIDMNFTGYHLTKR